MPAPYSEDLRWRVIWFRLFGGYSEEEACFYPTHNKNLRYCTAGYETWTMHHASRITGATFFEIAVNTIVRDTWSTYVSFSSSAGQGYEDSGDQISKKNRQAFQPFLKRVYLCWENMPFRNILHHASAWFSYPATYLRHGRRLQLTTFGDLFQWAPSASGMDHLRSKIRGKLVQIELVQFSNTSPVNMGRIVKLSAVCFHRQQPLINCQLAREVELSSTSQANRGSMLGTEYDSATNVHICPHYARGIWKCSFIPWDSEAYRPHLVTERSFENSGFSSTCGQKTF